MSWIQDSSLLRMILQVVEHYILVFLNLFMDSSIKRIIYMWKSSINFYLLWFHGYVGPSSCLGFGFQLAFWLQMVSTLRPPSQWWELFLFPIDFSHGHLGLLISIFLHVTRYPSKFLDEFLFVLNNFGIYFLSESNLIILEGTII